MAYKWTEGDVRSANLVDAEEFNTAYNNVKGELNGGLDRENLKDGSVTDHHLSPNAFVKYVLKDAITLQEASAYTQTYTHSTGTTVDREYFAIAYEKYSGGWVTNTAQQITDSFEEGMLHVNFNCWYWMASHLANLEVQTWCQFQIVLDGNPIFTSGLHFQNVGTVHLTVDVPIATGSHSIAIRWRLAPWQTRRDTDTPVFYYDGGQLLVINRYR
tara:strand:+ start:407 stop:1051 length:645 start_codon:yes stop_codon:yes gene_type:complete